VSAIKKEEQLSLKNKKTSNSAFQLSDKVQRAPYKLKKSS